MNKLTDKKISIVVPVFNEANGLIGFNKELVSVIEDNLSNYQLIYCDDGSQDNTSDIIHDLIKENSHIKYLKFSRNFGKENALTAGINYANGEAILMIDGDGQHPVELIPKFINSWLEGNKVVVGFRKNNLSKGLKKKLGSYLFYKTFNRITGQKILSGSTDYRLIDKSVQTEFVKLKDSDRITRGLIDWLGFKTSYVNFNARERNQGQASYSFHKLVRLAMNSYVGFSNAPLYFFGYLGVTISSLSFIIGVAILIEQLFLGDPLSWKFTGTAMLAIMIIFLVGIVLSAQGILSIYISLMHNQSKQRPLYIIDYQNSVGIDEKNTKN